MRRVMTEDGKEWYFNNLKREVGEWYQSWRTEEWYIITEVKEGEAVDEYGDVDRGWMHTMREATSEELTERNREQAAWEALMPEERTESRLGVLEGLFPNLDWGD